jgi:hypothetical protein
MLPNRWHRRHINIRQMLCFNVTQYVRIVVNCCSFKMNLVALISIVRQKRRRSLLKRRQNLQKKGAHTVWKMRPECKNTTNEDECKIQTTRLLFKFMCVLTLTSWILERQQMTSNTGWCYSTNDSSRQSLVTEHNQRCIDASLFDYVPSLSF